MTYILIIGLVLTLALLLSRLRLRVEISPDRRLLFVSLGRSGPEFDFRDQVGVLKLFGRRIKRFRFGSKAAEKKTTEPEETAEVDKKKTRRKRSRPVKSWVKIAPQCLQALGKYLLGLLQDTIVEQAEGEIEAGFESPALTGQMFGYYQAAIAAVPGFGRVQYIPVWSGQSFAGSARLSVAWPVYRLVWHTVLLVFRLPVGKIIRLTIGTKEGGQDG